MMRMMMVAVVGMAAMVSIAAASAPATVPGDAPADAALRMDDDSDPPTAAVPFRASGLHTCSEAGTDFTFTCRVSGELFKTCAEAEATLSADDCCPRKKAGAASTEFNMEHCTPR
ncbi:MAG: hypothetical protein K8W52_40905 [Deltaproteobacteria bacterium]|nr:hypothetical protein [Deltaproteobacteria bacterium]